MTGLESVERSYRSEMIRKGIHLASLSIPVIYSFISRHTALAILIPLTAAFLITDILRLFHPPSGRLYQKLFGFLLRQHEQNAHGRKLTGATYVLFSACLCVLLFPKVVVITAFAILIISDSAAALIGRRFGKHKFFTKSLEGSSAFFVSALLVIAVAPKIAYTPLEYVIGAVTAIVATVIEAADVRVDDNLTIPLVSGAVMWGLYLLAAPALNIHALDMP
jgi:dolichol kinase